MDLLRDPDIDPAPLAGKRVAILGYGNQGRAQALNLKDSGVDVVVGLRAGSTSEARVAADGLAALPLADVAASANLTMFLAPDETIAALYREVEPALRHGAAIGFSHGLAIRFGFVIPRPDLDVVMVAPKGPGTALRSLYAEGKGIRLGFENREAFEELPLDADHPALLAAMAKPAACGYWHDVGHAQIKQNMGLLNHREHLEKNAPNAIGFHLHDVSAEGRDHRPIGSGQIDFEMVSSFWRPEHTLVIELSPRLTPEEVLSSKQRVAQLVAARFGG